jgi:hydrogenase maturation protease
MGRTLVIGYGNIERGDDGAALHVVNRLRARWGQTPLTEDQVGILDPGRDTAVFVRQLLPELALDAAAFEVIVMVDVHVAQEGRPVACRRVLPEYRPPAFSHIVSPALFVWLVHAARGRHRSSFLVTLRGHCFELQRALSPATAALVDPTAEQVLQLTGNDGDRLPDVTA